GVGKVRLEVVHHRLADAGVQLKVDLDDLQLQLGGAVLFGPAVQAERLALIIDRAFAALAGAQPVFINLKLRTDQLDEVILNIDAPALQVVDNIAAHT